MNKAETELGDVIRRWRKQRGLTIHDLGDATGVSFTYISKIEHGRMVPSLPLLERIADTLGIDPISLSWPVLEAQLGGTRIGEYVIGRVQADRPV